MVCSLTFTLMILVSSDQDTKGSWILKKSPTLNCFSYWPHLWWSGDAFSLRHHRMEAQHWGKKIKKIKIYSNYFFSYGLLSAAHLAELFCWVNNSDKNTALTTLQRIGYKCFVKGLWIILL